MKDFFFSEISIHGSTIHLCRYNDFEPTEFMEYLTDIEKQRLLSFKHIRRRREFMATRILRHRAIGFQHINYDHNGAPYIEDEGFISISHSTNEVGLAVNPNFKVGLDLESPRPNVQRLMHKFLSEHEKKTFNISNVMEVCKIWSAKEAMYKLAGRKKIHFKSELLLNKDSDEFWSGRIINDDHDLSVKLNIFEQNNTIISINTESIVRLDKNI